MSQRPDEGQPLPWAPLYSIIREGQLETTVHGILYVWAEDRSLYANAGRALLRVGDTRFPLWMRSLLKPFQLMTLYPTIQKAYPSLTAKHFSLMTASHQGDAEQLAGLREIMRLASLPETALQCPACLPMKGQPDAAFQHALHHPCSGKHLAYLLYAQATQQPLASYLSSDFEAYDMLKLLLGYLLNREDWPETVDGCGMPNLSLSAVEMAQLYQVLVQPVSRDLIRQCPDELTEILQGWNEIAACFQAFPDLIGGVGRVDTGLMQACSAQQVATVAKEGADGLFCLGVGKTERYPDGLGLLLKLAHGYDPTACQRIVSHVLPSLTGISLEEPGGMPSLSSVQRVDFHFQLAESPVEA